MKFCWVTINVKEMEGSLAFYRDIVGLSVERVMKPNPNMQIAFLGSGETQVELIHDPVKATREYGDDISIGFEVDSIDLLMRTLASKDVKVEGGPFQPNPTVKFIYVLDPNGLRVQFVENVRK